MILLETPSPAVAVRRSIALAESLRSEASTLRRSAIAAVASAESSVQRARERQVMRRGLRGGTERLCSKQDHHEKGSNLTELNRRLRSG